MTLGWGQIVRLGLVQMAIGAIVVLMTSTLNRLMVVELALPAVLPGFLVALHYGVQLTRPHWGFRSDVGGARTRWIHRGMAMLAAGAMAAALGVILIERAFLPGLALSVAAYGLIGLGVGAGGTSLLALLASATHPRRRAAAATITWLMMILGIALTAGVAGSFLDPYGPLRLIAVVATVSGGALVVSIPNPTRCRCAPGSPEDRCSRTSPRQCSSGSTATGSTWRCTWPRGCPASPWSDCPTRRAVRPVTGCAPPW